MTGRVCLWVWFLSPTSIFLSFIRCIRPYSDHPLSALSHGNVSVVSSFNIGGVGDAFSDCVVGDRTM